MSPPYMPFYVGDYLADTGHLSAAENGAYLLLIMHYWRTGGLPLDDEMRRRVSRMTHREWQRSRDTVLSFFSDDGKHKRVDEELARVNHKTYVLRLNALKSHEARRANAQQGHLQNDCIPEPDPEPIEIRDADASLVNSEPVDPFPRQAKKTEKTESDQKLLDEVTDVWNRWAASHHCPQVKYLTGPRAVHCRHRIADIANGHGPIPAFEELLAKCEQSFFVKGVPRRPLRFNQLMGEKFMVEMMEGSYDYIPERQKPWRG